MVWPIRLVSCWTRP